MQTITAPDDVEAERLRLEYRLALLEAQDSAKNTFLGFSRYVWPEAILSSHHEKMAAAFDRIANGTLKRLIINMPPRHRFSLKTQVLTTTGWKTIGTVEPGDYVYAPSGEPVLVTGASPVYHEQLYEVETTDGHVIECDGEHLWTVSYSTKGSPYFDTSFKEMNTASIYERGSPKRGGPYLPEYSAIKGTHKELPIHPYVLGVWLGDGTKYGASIGCSTADEPEMRALIKSCGYETSDRDGYQMFGVLGLHAQLKENNLLQNKHIPEEYFNASIEQREALLQGLMDTDGSVGRTGRCTFHQTDLGLIKQVQALVCGLGARCRLTSRQTHYKGKPSQKSYRLNFKLARAARLSRKAERLKGNSQQSGRSIKVRKTERWGDVRCIKVANEDGLFLVGEGMVVGHNTKSEFASYLLPAYIMGRRPSTKIIQATHTGELAVRFGRKVRNLMDLDKYKEVFPDVALKADSKAAGRWDTNDGGEYFACLRKHVLIPTKRGLVSAGQICVGDELLTAGAWSKVLEVFNSEHETTVEVAGLECSLDHPVWTMDRGWVFAGQLTAGNVLCTESILDKVKAFIWRLYGYLEYPFIQALVQHKEPVRKPPEREVGVLWRAGHLCLRALADISEFFGRHGRGSFTAAYGGPHRQQRAVQPGELSMGDTGRSGQQSANKCEARQYDTGAARPEAWGNTGSDTVSAVQEAGRFVPTQAQEEELRTYGSPAGIGWFRCMSAWVLEKGGRGVFQPTGGAEGYLAGIARAAQKLQGLLLGVRRVGAVRIKHHGPRDFVNFRTDGDHSFFAASVLTHNCGVGGAMTGRGADMLIIDDPHSEQDAASQLALDNAWDWYTSGPRTRLQPGGAIVIVMTRWGTKDLTARLLKAQSNSNADQWEVIEFPAIFNEGEPNEHALWPSFWQLDELRAVRASMSVQKWNAMYQQRPTSDEGAILKREYWRIWDKDYMPRLEYIIQSYDTAYSKKETADFSVITTWGVFYPTEDHGPSILLIDMRKGRWDFPELKRIAKDQYDYWQPDNVLIEAKATGITLQQELRRMGIPVTMYSPGGRRAGQDKVSRANSVAPILESGMVWAPETQWAEELIEECAAFPNGDNDDLVDSTTQALMRFRAGNFVQLHDDEEEEESTESLVPEYY